MDRRTIVELIVALILILCGGIMMVLPILNVYNIKNVFVAIIAIYGIIHLFKNLAMLSAKDFSGFKTSLVSIGILLLMFYVDINDSPWNLALLLFIWIILMSLVKISESDYYHDHRNKLWKLSIFNLILFILVGILTTINLNYNNDIQILVLGFFFLIHGILELMDPLVAYIMWKK